MNIDFVVMKYFVMIESVLPYRLEPCEPFFQSSWSCVRPDRDHLGLAINRTYTVHRYTVDTTCGQLTNQNSPSVLHFIFEYCALSMAAQAEGNDDHFAKITRANGQ